MDDNTKKKLEGVGKVAYGTVKIVSGVTTAFGKGVAGTYFKNHHMTRAAAYYAKHSLESGSKLISDGWKKLND